MQYLNIYHNEHTVSTKILDCNLFIDKLKGLIFMPPPSDRDREGILFRKCNSIHMFFMRYPIDVMYFDKNKCLIRIHRSLKPWRISFCLSAAYVIEVAADSSWTKNFAMGDQFSW